MAKMGLKYLAWAEINEKPVDAIPTYHPGKRLGKMVSLNVTVQNAEGSLYADDGLAEYAGEFASGELAVETDNISLEDQANLYGARFEDGEMQHFGDDNAPEGGYGGYQVLLVHGVRKYRSWIFPRAKTIIPDETGATKGESISFATQPLKAKIMSPDFGPWKRVKEFDNEAAAKAYIDQFLNVASWHNVDVSISTGTSGNAASPAGRNSVSDGANFEIVITGTPTAVYDNGTDVTSSISGNKYTLTAVSENHSIAVIF